MKKAYKKLAFAIVPIILTALIIPAIFVNFNKDQLDTSSAFKDHYIPFTKKGEECLTLDQELEHQSRLLAGTMMLARIELNRITKENFKIDHNYEPVIRTAIKSFSDAQESHSLALKNTSKCWRDLKNLIEETSVAMGTYKEIRKADPELSQKESKLNKAEQELRNELLDPLDTAKLYEGFVKMASATDTNELRSIILSFDDEFKSLIIFREKMVTITSQRVALRSNFYASKKRIFAEVLSSDISSGFFLRTLWPF